MLSLKNAPVVIFGGSGFIGLHLAERLAGLGAFVTIADKDKPEGYLGSLRKRIEFKKTDIAKASSLKTLLRGKKYVVNLAAALPFSGKSDNYAHDCIDVNIKGAVNIALAAKASGVKKLVFVSGYVVYGLPKYLPMDECHPTNPIDFYGVSKLAAEKYLQVICQEAPKINTVILRLSSVYGQRQLSRGLIPNLIRASLNNSLLPINAGGREKRDYLFIDDAVCALVLSLASDATGIFNIGSQESISVNKVKNIIEELSEKKLKCRYLNNQGIIPEVILSNRLAKKYLGFKPLTHIREGLSLTYRWYEEHIHRL